MTGPDVVDLGFARVDVAREARQGLPEAVYGSGKTADQVIAIDTVHVHGMPVRRKHGPRHGKPEYDDDVARQTGLPLRTVPALAAESPEEH